MGDADPLWAVLVESERKDSRWDLQEFLESGRKDWVSQQLWLESLGLPTGGKRVLDFGCGVGRMALALSDSFESVVGLDISSSMLKVAADLSSGNDRCIFLHSTSPDLHIVDDLAPFDFVHTLIVLQHVPRQLIPVYLRELVRILRPGGVLVFQLPVRRLVSWKGLFSRYLPGKLVGGIQRKFLKYPAPMSMNGLPVDELEQVLNSAGATIVAHRRDKAYEAFWESRRYVAIRNAD